MTIDPTMTEDEAKRKFCPQTLVRPFEGSNSPSECIGAMCMAWTWARHTDFREVGEPALGYCALIHCESAAQ